MGNGAASRPLVLAACIALLLASGCAAPAPGAATPSPEPSGARPTTDRGTQTPSSTPAGTSTATPATPAATTAGTATPGGLADRVPAPGTTSTIVPAPATPTFPPASGPVEITGDIQAFMDAARIVTGRGEAVTAASLGAASPQVAALLAAGAARLTGDALQIYVTYATDADAARAAIEAAGGIIEQAAPAQRLIQARIPVTRLATLQASTAITRIRLPETAVR